MNMNDLLPPGSTEPSLLQGMRFGAAPYAYLDEQSRRHGDCFTLRLPGDPLRVVCSHPEDIRRIFALTPDAYIAGNVSFPLNIGPRGLLFLDGEQHLSDRRLMVPPLHGDHLPSYARTMQRIAVE